MPPKSKETEITAIHRLVGAADPGLGIGSSVPKPLFDGVCRRFNLDASGTMPTQAERVIRAAGLPYNRRDSTALRPRSLGGSTVTLDGLMQIKAAVHRLIAREQ